MQKADTYCDLPVTKQGQKQIWRQPVDGALNQFFGWADPQWLQGSKPDKNYRQRKAQNQHAILVHPAGNVPVERINIVLHIIHLNNFISFAGGFKTNAARVKAANSMVGIITTNGETSG